MATYCRTLTKSRIKGVFEFYNFCQKNRLTNTPSYRKVKRWIRRSIETINRIIYSNNNRRLPIEDRRGTKRILDSKKINKIEVLIQENRYKGYNQKLDSIRHKYKLPKYSNRTIIRALKEREIRFYITASKEEVVEGLASIRVEFCIKQLKNLDRVFSTRFSDKMHYS